LAAFSRIDVSLAIFTCRKRNTFMVRHLRKPALLNEHLLLLLDNGFYTTQWNVLPVGDGFYAVDVRIFYRAVLIVY
jgi:hypothetical protein